MLVASAIARLDALEARCEQLAGELDSARAELAGLREDFREVAEQAAAAGRARQAAAAAPRHGVPVAPLVPRVDARPWYAVVKVPDDLGHIVGLWHSPWARLAAHLPNESLAGSRVTLKKFPTEIEARAFWHAKWISEPPTHDEA